MLASFLRKPVRVVAPDPTRRNALMYLIYYIGAVVALLLVLTHLPGPISNLIGWQSPPLPSDWQMVYDLTSGAILAGIGACFFPYADMCLSRKWSWKELEPSRQQAAAALLQGILPVLFPLPTVVGPLPTTISIHTLRNWRATATAVATVTLLWGFCLVKFFYNWQPNLQPFAQQGQIGLMMLKIIINLALYSIPILPAFLAIILAPRQLLLADQDGLYCYLGPRATYIPWHEARLFSVIAEEYGILVYELASEISLIRWSYTLMKGNFPYATFGSAPFKIAQGEPSEDEHRQRIRRLTVLVAEKTGLPLVDLRQLTDAQRLTDAADHMVS